MSMSQRNCRRWFCVLLVMGGSAAAPVGRAQTFSPYSDFQAMAVADLATLQVKLTYMGDQTAVLGTVLFGATSNSLDAVLFYPFHRPGQSYGNDGFGQNKFTASVQELKALIDSVATLPGVTDGGVDSGGWVSFSLLNTAGGTTKVFEAIVDSINGPALFGKMVVALKGNAGAVRSLRNFGCSAGVLPTTPPADVDAQVQVKSSGLRADRARPTQYVGKVRVTNTSGATIQAPLLLIAVVHADSDLIGNDGETCSIEPPGRHFINLLLSGGLAPGAAIERTLRFTNASKSKLNVEFKVYAGPGTP